MNNENAGKPKTSLLFKIMIPVLIACVIAGIWIIKNSKNNVATETPETTDASEAENPDFALNVTETLDLETLESYGLPIIIEFGSDSCIPCQQMAPIIEALNEELQGKAIILFVDVWKYPDLADGIPLSVIPTQVFIDAEGNPYSPEDPDALSMNLYDSNDTGELVFTTHEGTITKDELLTILEEMGMQS